MVPDEWLSRYTYALGDIKQVVGSLCELLEKRLPPPTATQHEMLTRKFWTGREFFVVIDDATVWPTADNPLARLAPYVEQADSLGLHLIAAALGRWFWRPLNTFRTPGNAAPEPEAATAPLPQTTSDTH